MEVKIGIQNVGREIVLESSLDAEAAPGVIDPSAVDVEWIPSVRVNAGD